MSDDLRQKAEARYAEAREKVSEAISSGRAAADEALKSAKTHANEAISTARTKADEAYTAAKAKAGDAAAKTRAGAQRASRATSEGIKTSPIAAVAGGLAIGAIVAALLPRTQREDQALGKTGKRVRTTAGQAAKAAKDAGQKKLDALGVNGEAARDQVRDLLKKVGEAAGTAGTAAANAVKSKKK